MKWERVGRFGKGSLLRAPASQAAQNSHREAGYVVIDAMVALMIIAVALIEGLGAVRNANQASQMALEVRRARQLLVHLAELTPPRLGEQRGVSDGFSWRVETTVTGGDRPIEICRRSVVVVQGQTRRRYQAASLQACPALGVP